MSMSKAELPDMPSSPDTYLRRAHRYVRVGEWVSADECFLSATAHDPTPASRIAFATSLVNRERYHDAICHLTMAIDQASAEGDLHALGVIYHNLAAVYREVGDSELAQRFQQRALLHMEDCGSEDLLGLANDAWLSNRHKLAETLAVSATETEGSDWDAEATLAILSAVRSGKSRHAIHVLIASYRQHRQEGEFRLMGIDLMNLSILLGQRGRYQGEISTVRRATECFERAAALISVAKTRRLLSELMRTQSVRSFDPTLN